MLKMCTIKFGVTAKHLHVFVFNWNLCWVHILHKKHKVSAMQSNSRHVLVPQVKYIDKIAPAQIKLVQQRYVLAKQPPLSSWLLTLLS